MRRVVAVAIAAAVLLLGGGMSAWWWTHPTLFHDGGVREGMDHVLPVSQAHLTVGVIFPPPHGTGEVVQLQAATAHFARNSAGARVTFAVCRGGMIGVALDPRRHCRSLDPLPTPYRDEPGSDESMVMTATATKPGRVWVDGVVVEYRRGRDRLWQHGRQTLNYDVRFTAR